MRVVELASPTDFAGWREAARALLAQDVAPRGRRSGAWAASADLFGGRRSAGTAAERAACRRAAFARAARLHRARRTRRLPRRPGRFALLYRLLWRLRDDHDLLSRTTDDDVFRAPRHGEDRAARAPQDEGVRALPRDRATRRGALFVAWFEPEHHIVELHRAVLRAALRQHALVDPDAAGQRPLGRRRACASVRAPSKADAPGGDALEDHWRTYYASIFNPARLKVERDEERDADELLEEPARERADRRRSVREAAQREMQMIAAEPTPEPRRAQIILDRMKQGRGSKIRQKRRRGPQRARRRCARRRWAAVAARCGENATQTVFGEGPGERRFHVRRRTARRPGRSCGPGRSSAPRASCSTSALEEAGIDRARAYVTNAVKHFKFEPRGKRRLHKTPNAGEIQRLPLVAGEGNRLCVQPKLVVALGATRAPQPHGRAHAGFSSCGERWSPRRWRARCSSPSTRPRSCARATIARPPTAPL